MALVNPHGSKKKLTPRLLHGTEREEEIKRAQNLPRIEIGSREKGDLLMIGMGAFTPLTGFMGKEDWEGVIYEMKLRKSDPGTMWPIPICCSIDAEQVKNVKEGSDVALWDKETGTLMATMTVEEVYQLDEKAKREECIHVYKTDDMEHPGVAMVMGQGEYNIAGPVKVLTELDYPEKYGDYYLHPAQARAIFEEKGWSTVAAFQTRNPIHRSHEYLTKVAQEVSDGVFIHALVGKLKPGDIPAEVRMKCYEVLIDKYYNKDRTVLGVYPLDMRYAGPKEALLHAIFRQNFGCSHLIVGRDHAGVGDYYGVFEAQEIFDKLWPGALELRPLKMDWTFYCYKCEGMASLKTCPHGNEDRLVLSGTKLRRMLAEGQVPPREFSRPEVIEILVKYYQELAQKGVKVEIKKGAYEDLPGAKK